jgi:hypothetical protein
MIPVYLKAADGDQPVESTYYLLAANGVFLVKKSGLFSSVTATETLIGLDQQSPSISLSFPKLPRDLLERVYGFFRFVFERLDGEAVVFLYYSPGSGEFHVDAPPQRLTRYRTRRGWRTEGNVEYRALARPDGFLKLGDAHSHGDSHAFFSSIDDRDDAEDGLRVVMGRLDRPQPDVRVSFMANGTRFKLDAADVLEDFRQPVPPSEEWIRRVVCRYKDSRSEDRRSGNEHGWH